MSRIHTEMCSQFGSLFFFGSARFIKRTTDLRLCTSARSIVAVPCWICSVVSLFCRPHGGTPLYRSRQQWLETSDVSQLQVISPFRKYGGKLFAFSMHAFLPRCIHGNCSPGTKNTTELEFRSPYLGKASQGSLRVETLPTRAQSSKADWPHQSRVLAVCDQERNQGRARSSPVVVRRTGQRAGIADQILS